MTVPAEPALLYAVVVLAAAAHAGWNALIKQSSDPLISLAGIRLVGLLAAVALFFWVPLPGPESWPYLAAHTLCIYLYYFFLLNAYRTGEFSTVYPIARGTAPMVVLLVTLLFSVEPLTVSEIIATVIIALGIAAFAHQQSASSAAVGFALATGITIGCYSLMGGLGVRSSGSTLGYLAASEFHAAAGLVPYAWIKRRQQINDYLRAHAGSLLGAGVMSISAFGAVMWIYNYLPIAPVSAVRESSVAFAVLIGVFVLREALNWQKLLGLTLVISGTISLALLG